MWNGANLDARLVVKREPIDEVGARTIVADRFDSPVLPAQPIYDLTSVTSAGDHTRNRAALDDNREQDHEVSGRE